MDFAMAVILYQPNEMVLDNILSYINFTKYLYVIDNSNSTPTVVEKIKKYSCVTYISMHGNKGIAAALNVAVSQAKKNHIPYLITMDQDSKFEQFNFYGYVHISEKLFDKYNNIAVVGINYNGYAIKHPDLAVEIVDEVITSGMIINIDVMKRLGCFIDDLFIDYVDYEYCYRARKNGYLCLMVNKYKLSHQIGGLNPITKFGIHFHNHNEYNCIRQYYMARNVIYVIRKYPTMASKWIKNLIKAPIKILLVDDNKTKKFRGYIRGIIDGVTGHYKNRFTI